MHPMLNIGVRAALAAGRIITRNVDRLDPAQISQKQRNDYVTEVDHAAESEIIKVLNKAYPDHAIFGEESGLVGDAEAEYQWIVDPLDGTMNFIHGLPHFSVSIALMQKGRPFQAVVYDPMRQELFTAGKGEGAFLDNKRLRVTATRSLDKALISMGFPNRPGQRYEFNRRLVNHFSMQASGVRRLGSAALDLAYVASGRFDATVLMGLSSWDVAAGALLVREAGGLVNDFSAGGDWLEKGELIAGNPRIQHELLKDVAALSRENAKDS